MSRKVEDVLRLLAAESRVVMIGGLAVIAHGFSRPTKDADIWLDPSEGAAEWLANIQRLLEPGETIHCLPGWVELEGAELLENAKSVGMLRVKGLSMPLDIFYKPNGLQLGDFERVWTDGRELDDGTRLPKLLDLLCTKEETNRQHDFQDASYLLGMARVDQSRKLKAADDVKEAEALLNEFFDYAVLEAGLENPREEVRDLVKREIKVLAADGDPFAKEMLEGTLKGLEMG